MTQGRNKRFDERKKHVCEAHTAPKTSVHVTEDGIFEESIDRSAQSAEIYNIKRKFRGMRRDERVALANRSAD